MERMRWLTLIAIGLFMGGALVGCASSGLATFHPQVMVTRVPFQPAEANALVEPEAPASASQPVSASAAITMSAGAAGDAAPDQAAEGQPAAAAADGAAQASFSEDGLPLADDSAGNTTEGDHPLQHTHNILLLGTDQRDLGYLGRTDTIIVLAVDTPNSRAALISLPRDIYLPIPGVGYSRINTAYPYGEERKPGGGIALLESTIEKNFDIPIHSYVRVDFSGFEEVVDALGGVDITVDCPLYDELVFRYFGTPALDAGQYHMNGEQALYYARSRKTTSDFDRARRQQQVLMALRRRVLEGGMVSRVPALWMALRDTVETDMNAADVVQLAKLGAALDSQHLYGMVLRSPLVSDWVTPQGGQVQLPDLPAISEALDHIWERKSITVTNQEEKPCP